MCVLIFSRTYVWNIPDSKKNWGKNVYWLHVQYPLFLPNFNKTWFFGQIFEKFSWKSLQWSQVVPCGRTAGRTHEQTDMTKLILAFCNFANRPKYTSITKHIAKTTHTESRHHHVTKLNKNITPGEPTQTGLCLNSLESVTKTWRTRELVKGRR